MSSALPPAIAERQDKMGFPVPLTEWMSGDAREFIYDLFSTTAAKNRALIDNQKVLDMLDSESRFGRTVWGFLCLEIWQQEFHDKQHEYKRLINE